MVSNKPAPKRLPTPTIYASLEAVGVAIFLGAIAVVIPYFFVLGGTEKLTSDTKRYNVLTVASLFVMLLVLGVGAVSWMKSFVLRNLVDVEPSKGGRQFTGLGVMILWGIAASIYPIPDFIYEQPTFTDRLSAMAVAICAAGLICVATAALRRRRSLPAAIIREDVPNNSAHRLNGWGLFVCWGLGLMGVFILSNLVSITGGTANSFFSVLFVGLVSVVAIVTERARHTFSMLMTCSIASYYTLHGTSTAADGRAFTLVYYVMFVYSMLISTAADYWRQNQRSEQGPTQTPRNSSGHARQTQ